ncbi:MAG: hypothetical protein AAGG08_03215 [Actinomycetota bacterium]
MDEEAERQAHVGVSSNIVDAAESAGVTHAESPAVLMSDETPPRQPRRGLRNAGLAAAALVICGGAALLSSCSDSDDAVQSSESPSAVVPSATTAPASATTVPAATTAAPASSAPDSTAPTPSTTVELPDGVIAVEVGDDLPVLELLPFATAPWDEPEPPHVAVGELGVVLSDPASSSITLLGFNGERRAVQLEGEAASSELRHLAYGPGDVVYGLRRSSSAALEIVAVPLSGERPGQIIARSQPLDGAEWAELPRSPFGHGSDGIIARAGDPGATLIGYVDVDGSAWAGPVWIPTFPEITDELIVSADSTGVEWMLAINGQRRADDSFSAHPVPAPSTDGDIVYATHLDDEQTQPVIAVFDLSSEADASWFRPPTGFDYVASDDSGTAFGRLVDGSLEIRLLASERTNWRTLGSEFAGVRTPCAGCTQLLVGTDGVNVTFDPSTRRLVRHSVPPVEATLPESYSTEGRDVLGGGIRPFLQHLGPDEVVYLGVAPAVAAELAVDIVAVTLSDGDAGREVGRWAATDNVGDSQLVAATDGLVNVNCCGPDTIRPAPDAPVRVPWATQTGDVTTSSAPMISVELDGQTLTVVRTDQVPARTTTWTFEPHPNWYARGMPWILPTFDGGFISATYDGGVTISRGWPDGTTERLHLDRRTPWPALDPSGRIVVPDGDFFVRIEPFADRNEYWDGERQFDIESTGDVVFPGLDEALATNPGWASSPVTFGSFLVGPPQVNEIRSIESTQVSESRWEVSVTTSNFFDDSSAASRVELTLGRTDEGQFRFIDGMYGWTCQPGRGRQEFGLGPCI